MSDQARLEDEFRQLLRSHDVDDLASERSTVWGMWDDGRLAFINRGWFDFARDNGGEPGISRSWGLGRSVLDAYSEDLRSFYEGLYHDCLAKREVQEHEYHCPSAFDDRLIRQTIYPLDGKGLLVTNAIIVEQPHADGVEGQIQEAPDEDMFRNRHGIITQCSHCRKIEHPREEKLWVWIPEWVSRFPPNTSHGLCPACFGFYYPIG